MSHTLTPFLSPHLKVQAEKDLNKIWEKKIRNLHQAWQEYTAQSTSLQSLPFKLSIELTQNCNYKCVMCSHAWLPKYNTYNPALNMTPEVFAQIAQELFPYATSIDLRANGETMILPYWPEILETLESFPFIEWNLITNFSLKNSNVWEKMADIGFILGFSCDGASKKVFEEIRVNSNFDHVLENLSTFTKSMVQKKKGYVYILSTIQHANMHELADIIRLAKKYSVPEVQFHPAKDWLPQISLSQANPKLLSKYANEALDMALELNIKTHFNFEIDANPQKIRQASEITPDLPNQQPSPLMQTPGFSQKIWDELRIDEILNNFRETEKVKQYQSCFKPFSHATFNYKGEVGPCNCMIIPDIKVMGNYANSKIFEKIWNNQEYQNFRGALLKKTPEDKNCQWCFKNRMVG